jgi:hypothetical protein
VFGVIAESFNKSWQCNRILHLPENVSNFMTQQGARARKSLAESKAGFIGSMVAEGKHRPHSLKHGFAFIA